MRALILLLVMLLLPITAHSTTYYISPSGSDLSNGLTSATPWFSFAFAINPTRASCGDTLIVMDGTYGDGPGLSGNISISSLTCTLGDELTVRAENQRQAKIDNSGSGRAVNISASAYIIIDGLYARSTDNSGSTASESGEPFHVSTSNHITLRNNVARNVNRYANSHIYDVLYSQDVLLEDNEAYVYHRHCVMAWQSERVVVRRQYCNPRGGAITGGFGAANGLNRADAVISMYPCKDCILENSIGDGTTSSLYLSEMNATYGGSILMSGSKVLGSICYKCNYGNGLSYLNSRSVADLNHTPQNITIRNTALVNWAGTAQAIRITDGVGITLDQLTILGTGTATRGIWAEDGTAGVGAASNSITMTNLLVSSAGATGLSITGFNTWSGDEIFSVGNTTAFNPTPPSNWTNTSTAAHGMGTCTVWVPAGAAVKGAGTSGGDIGATILYRYVNGILTTTQLWDETTGAFPYGAADPDGVNRVVGDSLFDIHTRLNVDTGGCSFPSGYATGGGVPADPANYVSSYGTTNPSHSHTVDAGMDSLTVGISLYDSGGNVGTVSGVTACGGQALTQLATQVTTPAYRRVYLFGKINPTSGTCTITATTSGTITASAMVSIETDNISAYDDTATATGLSGTPSVTVPTNTGETIIDMLAGKCGLSAGACASTLTAGANQTLEVDQGNLSVNDIRAATSMQAGADGGVMSWTSANSYWALAAVALLPTSPGAPSTATLTQSEYMLCDGYGADATVLCRAANTGASVGPQGLVRMQLEITGGVATTTEFGVALYCSRNGGAYAQAMNSYGSNAFRLYGAGPSALNHPIPASLDTITARLGSPVATTFLRDTASVYIVPALTVGQTVEVGFEVQLNAAAGDSIACRVRKDDGTVLDTYTNTPTITVRTTAANAGY